MAQWTAAFSRHIFNRKNFCIRCFYRTGQHFKQNPHTLCRDLFHMYFDHTEIGNRTRIILFQSIPNSDNFHILRYCNIIFPKGSQNTVCRHRRSTENAVRQVICTTLCEQTLGYAIAVCCRTIAKVCSVNIHSAFLRARKKTLNTQIHVRKDSSIGNNDRTFAMIIRESIRRQASDLLVIHRCTAKLVTNAVIQHRRNNRRIFLQIFQIRPCRIADNRSMAVACREQRFCLIQFAGFIRMNHQPNPLGLI